MFKIFPQFYFNIIIFRNSFDSFICFGSAKFGQKRAFLKPQIICNNLKLGGMHDSQEKVLNLTSVHR